MIKAILLALSLVNQPVPILDALSFKVPEIILNERQLLKDYLPSLFVEFEREYLPIIAKNYGRIDRWEWDSKQLINGTWYFPWKIPHSWCGDLDGNDKVNLVDLAIYAKHFTGGLYKPKPPPDPPEPMSLEVKALIIKLFLEN